MNDIVLLAGCSSWNHPPVSGLELAMWDTVENTNKHWELYNKLTPKDIIKVR